MKFFENSLVIGLVGALPILAFRYPFKNFPGFGRNLVLREEVDGKEFEDVLKSIPPVLGKGMSPEDQKTFNNIRESQAEKAEELFREYPFETIDLPILPDCNNYYSGKFGEYFWHQNADQVYLFIPVDEELKKKDVEVKFAAKSVEVKIKGEEVISFECLERIIPDGSFWVFESDGEGKRYIQLDMEKRFRMINWKGLFGQAEEDPKVLEDRSKMLEKLLAANKGLSKVSGVPPETMTEMLQNEDLLKMMTKEVKTTPEITLEMEDGDEKFEAKIDAKDAEALGVEDFEIVNEGDEDNKDDSDEDFIDAEFEK